MAYTELQEDTKIKASVLNANFQAMKDYAQELISASDTTLDAKIETTKTSLTNSYNSLNSTVVKLAGAQTVTGNKTFTGTSTFSGRTYVKAENVAGTALCNVETTIDSNSDSKPRGYMKLGNRVFIQWGYKHYQNANTNVTISFPKPFHSENDYCFVMTTERSGMGSYTPIIIQRSSGSVIIRGDSNDTAFWFAIGKGDI